ncbi:MAG: ribonuclease activity regulator RraA [Alphaproteobacteria bacterium]|nr:ribonuclease activity regulator RraA [Alphaproteobacteria bacterium]
MALSGETRRLLQQASVATLATQLLKRGLRNTVMAGPAPLAAPAQPMVGEAFTLRYIPAREDIDDIAALGDREHPQRKAIETVPPGQVLVVDCRGERGTAAIGAILAVRLRVRGVAGLVADGGVRDAAEAAGTGLPIFCLGAAAPANVTRHHAADFGRPIACGGVAVYPGDIIVGDGDGVVVVPAHLADEIAAPAAEQERLEAFLFREIAGGAPLFGTYPPDADTMARYRGGDRTGGL